MLNFYFILYKFNDLAIVLILCFVTYQERALQLDRVIHSYDFSIQNAEERGLSIYSLGN